MHDENSVAAFPGQVKRSHDCRLRLLSRVSAAYAALGFSFVFHIWHLMVLPILMTWDGIDYISLSKLFKHADFFENWRYYRTFGYPLFLSASFGLFGHNPIAAQLPNMLYGFGGIALIWLALFRLGRPVAAALCTIVLTFYPVLVTFEHAVLTEMGSFFFLSASVFVLVSAFRRWWIKPCVLAVLFTIAFYHRMTLIYIAPAAMLICIIQLWGRWRSNTIAPQAPYRTVRIAAVAFGSLAIPMLAAYPFNRQLYSTGVRSYADNMTVYGLIKQVVIPPQDMPPGGNRDMYEKAIAGNTHGGRLDWGGLPQVYMLTIQNPTNDPGLESPLYSFVRLVLKYPGRYLSGIFRSLIYFAGARSAEDEIGAFAGAVILNASAGSRLSGVEHEEFEEARQLYSRPGSDSIVASGLGFCLKPYRLLLPLGFAISILGLGLALWRRDALLLSFCAMPLTLVAFHVLMLITIGRYVAPAYPLLLANLFIVPSFYLSVR